MIGAKKQARNAVTYALRTGRLVRQACEECANPASEAHHDDYGKPLVVRWLCRRCHNKVHGRGVDSVAVIEAYTGSSLTLRAVGAAFGISGPRVHQILAAHGLRSPKRRAA